MSVAGLIEKETVPALETLFEQFSNDAAVLYLEMKCDNGAYESLARACVELIHKHSVVDRTIVECFDLNAIAEAKRLDPTIRTAALFEPAVKRPLSLITRGPMIERARDCQADEIALHHRLVTQRIVERAKHENMPCVVWTVDQSRWVQRAANLGLKALITNNPKAMRGESAAGSL
jgi:glycerophosphoryl diester phosphodiesterase